MPKTKSMLNNVTVLITSWSPNEYCAVKEQLIHLGFPEEQILITKEKISRPIVLNKYLKSCKTPFIMFCDDDILLDNDKDMFNKLLKYFDDPKVGLVTPYISQVLQFEHNLKNTADYKSKDISRLMITLNCSIVRVNTGVLFDEDLFGNQIFDVDFGLSLLKAGYLSISDGSTHLQHIQTAFFDKNLFYHVCVARNRHIFRNKWSTETNLEEVPTLEQISHASEDNLLKYLKAWEPIGASMYLNSRFGDKINDHLRHLEKIMNDTNPKEVFWQYGLCKDDIFYEPPA